MILFGIIDNAVLLACLCLGVEFGPALIPHRYRSQAAGAALGAMVGNALSDGLAAIPLGLRPALEVSAGWLAVLVALPLAFRRLARQ